jgi:hypothetical protein
MAREHDEAVRIFERVDRKKEDTQKDRIKSTETVVFPIDGFKTVGFMS